MTHPELLLLPIMMFADYFLTILGAIQRERRYSNHFKTLHYELNPIWQKDVAQKKWFNPRHIALTIALSALLIFLIELGIISDRFSSIMIGGILVIYGMILGRHISNLLIFGHLARRPEDISGEITMSPQFVLYLSLYHSLMIIIPIALIALFSGSNFAIGGAIGMILFFIVNLSWILKARKQKATSNNDIQPTS